MHCTCENSAKCKKVQFVLGLWGLRSETRIIGALGGVAGRLTLAVVKVLKSP